MAQYPGFLRLTNLEIHAGRLFAFLICKQIVTFGGHESFTVRILGDFPHFLSALLSNNQFIVKLVKMWPGGTPHVVVGTLKISLDRLKKKNTRSLVECCRVSTCEYCVMPACGSKFMSGSSRKATVAESVFVG